MVLIVSVQVVANGSIRIVSRPLHKTTTVSVYGVCCCAIGYQDCLERVLL